MTLKLRKVGYILISPDISEQSMIKKTVFREIQKGLITADKCIETNATTVFVLISQFS